MRRRRKRVDRRPSISGLPRVAARKLASPRSGPPVPVGTCRDRPASWHRQAAAPMHADRYPRLPHTRRRKPSRAPAPPEYPAVPAPRREPATTCGGPVPGRYGRGKPSKVDLQLDDVRRELKAGLSHRNGLVEPSGFGQLIGIFAKGRRKRLTSCGGLAQLIQRLVAPPGGGERCRKQRFDFRVVAAPRRPLERCMASAGRFWIKKAWPRMTAAALLLRFAFRTPSASRSASPGLPICNASVARSSAASAAFRLAGKRWGSFDMGVGAIKS